MYSVYNPLNHIGTKVIRYDKGRLEDKLIQLGAKSERIQHKYNLQPTFYIEDKGLTSYKRKYTIRRGYNQHNKE